MLGILLMGQPAMTGFAFTVIPGRADRHGRVGDPAAGPARASPAATSSACTCRSSARTSTPTTPRAGTGGAGSSSAGRGSPPSAASSSCWRWRRRSSASGSGSPTPRTTRRLHHPPGLRPARRRVRPRLLGAAGAHRRRGSPARRCRPRADAVGDQLRRGQRRGRGRAGGRQRRRRHRRCCASCPPRPRRTRPPRTSSTRCATTAIPAATAGTGLTVARRRDRWPRTSTAPAASLDRLPSSSAASCWCRSCC